MLKFYSIDIETTGLDSKKHGVTEFAAVFTDVCGSFPPKTFSRWLDPEGYIWSNFCLKLHQKWIDRVTTRINDKALAATDSEPMICRDATELIYDFKTWMFTECGHPVPMTFMQRAKSLAVDFPVEKWEKITSAGKNFGSFDKNFLEAMDWPAMFRHRSLDPTMLYFDKDKDDVLPELAECKKRAIEEGCKDFEQEAVTHAALADAVDVAKLIWWRYNSSVFRNQLGKVCPACSGRGMAPYCPTCKTVSV